MALIPTENSQRYLRIASTLCYLQGAFTAVSAIVFGVSALAPGSSNGALVAAFMVVMLSGTVAFGVAGQGLRRLQRRAAYLAFGITTMSVTAQIAVVHSILIIWLAVGVAMVLLIVRGWPELRIRSAETVAPVA